MDVKGENYRLIYGNIDEQHYLLKEHLQALLKSDGWYLVTTKGSHRQYKHPIKKGQRLKFSLEMVLQANYNIYDFRGKLLSLL